MSYFKVLTLVVCNLVLLASCSRRHDDNNSREPTLDLRGQEKLPKEWKVTFDVNSLPILEGAKVEPFSISGEFPHSPSLSYSLSNNSDRLLVADGESKATNLPYIFDLESKIWTPIPTDQSLPSFITTKMVLDESGLLYWGGADVNGCGLSGGRFFDFERRLWVELPRSELESRAMPHVAFYKGQILFFGGTARLSGKCPEQKIDRDFIRRNGQFFSVSEKKWGRRLEVPALYVPAGMSALGTLMSGDNFLVWMQGMNSAMIVALDLTTDTWFEVAKTVSPADPYSLRLAKTTDGFAVAQFSGGALKDGGGPISVKFYRTNDIHHPEIVQTELPAGIDFINPNWDDPLMSGSGFIVHAYGFHDGENILKRALVMADAKTPVMPLPDFGESLPQWNAIDGGVIGLSKDKSGKTLVVYFNLSNDQYYRLPEIDADLSDLRIRRYHNGELVLIFDGNARQGFSVKVK